jgi:hypothetical protein
MSQYGPGRSVVAFYDEIQAQVGELLGAKKSRLEFFKFESLKNENTKNKNIKFKFKNLKIVWHTMAPPCFKKRRTVGMSCPAWRTSSGVQWMTPCTQRRGVRSEIMAKNVPYECTVILQFCCPTLFAI